jgi:histidine triad (HIT) family protein
MTEDRKEDCLFCAIAGHRINASLVYEDERAVAFRDIHPQAPVHILIVPRRHIPSLNEIGEEDRELVGHLIRVASDLARRESVADSGWRLAVNCGPAAGQAVAHLHIHLLGGRALGWPPG